MKDGKGKSLDLLNQLVTNVTSSERGLRLLADNPIDQLFVFEIIGDESVMMSVKSGSSKVSISAGSRPYKYPEVCLCKTKIDILSDLLNGKLRVGRAYIENLIELRGQLLAKVLLGNMVRINQEVLYPFLHEEFKHAK